MAKKAKADPNVISFLCGKCRARLKVPRDQAGRFIDCPKCQGKAAVPLSQKEADEEAIDYKVNLMAYDVPDKCTKCGKRMAKGAVLCVHCGFDYRKGKQLKVEDHTVKEDDEVRGGPALQAMIVDVLVAIGLVVALFVRLGMEGVEWYEPALYLGGLIGMILFAVGHFMQWNEYRSIPIREDEKKLLDDRAEREEATLPLGRFSYLFLLLAIGAGLGLGYLIWHESHPSTIEMPGIPFFSEDE